MTIPPSGADGPLHPSLRGSPQGSRLVTLKSSTAWKPPSTEALLVCVCVSVCSVPTSEKPAHLTEGAPETEPERTRWPEA